MREELTQNINIIINGAAAVELKEELETSVRVNVTGALQLLQLAQDCPNISVFCQVSTCYVNADRAGYVEERMYQSDIDWASEYQSACQ